MSQTAKKLKANCQFLTAILWHQREQILVVNGLLLSASFMNRWCKKSSSGPDAGWANSESRRAKAWRPESLLTLIGRTHASA